MSWSDCIEHTQASSPTYANTTRKGEQIKLHRAVLFDRHVPIAGMVVMHLCSNRRCINPDHLTVGSQSDNLLQCVAEGKHPNANKTHCKHGHEFTPENTRVSAKGWRWCRACAARYRQERRQRNAQRA